MEISDSGNGLKIVIGCDYSNAHNWMSFISWYSLSKNLPDAEVFVSCNRTLMKNSLFGWTKKCKVPFFIHKTVDKFGQIAACNVKNPVLYIPVETICVRDFSEANFSPNDLSEEQIYFLNEDLSCDCKQDKPCVFATYLNGWGRFVTSEWINRMNSPFIPNVKFDSGDMTTNEIRISKLWKSATTLFQTVSRG